MHAYNRHSTKVLQVFRKENMLTFSEMRQALSAGMEVAGIAKYFLARSVYLELSQKFTSFGT